MTARFSFTQTFAWALLPRERRTGMRAPEDPIIFDSFRYIRGARRQESCAPWRIANQLGWDICSPVDVNFTPLSDMEIVGNLPNEEVLDLAARTELKEIWRRGGNYLALPTSHWLRLYDFKVDSGWKPMFVPNGRGSVEWNLGWEAKIPAGYGLHILPFSNLKGIKVHEGILLSRHVEGFSGFSIAIEISKRSVIRRGDVIARILPIAATCLSCTSTYTSHASLLEGSNN